jgi:RNA polymerase sigma-70 factor (ECF subfamily)
MNVEQRYLAKSGGAEDESLATRSSLLSRLRDASDQASWQTFFDTYWRLIYNVARKSGLDDPDAQDVVQETVIAVARRMPDFRYDPAKGSFKSWLLLITRRRIHDHFRRRYRQPFAAPVETQACSNPSQDTPAPVQPPDEQIDEAWEQEWQRSFFQTTLNRVRQKANPKHYQVFDCCVLQNLPAAEVARMLGLGVAQVYLIKHRMCGAVKRAARELEAELGREAGA